VDYVIYRLLLSAICAWFWLLSFFGVTADTIFVRAYALFSISKYARAYEEEKPTLFHELRFEVLSFFTSPGDTCYLFIRHSASDDAHQEYNI